MISSDKFIPMFLCGFFILIGILIVFRIVKSTRKSNKKNDDFRNLKQQLNNSYWRDFYSQYPACPKCKGTQYIIHDEISVFQRSTYEDVYENPNDEPGLLWQRSICRDWKASYCAGHNMKLKCKTCNYQLGKFNSYRGGVLQEDAKTDIFINIGIQVVVEGELVAEGKCSFSKTQLSSERVGEINIWSYNPPEIRVKDSPILQVEDILKYQNLCHDTPLFRLSNETITLQHQINRYWA